MSDTTIGTIELVATINTSQFKRNAKDIERTTGDLADKAESSSTRSSNSFLKMGAALGIVTGAASVLVSKGINLITSSLSSAIKRVDTLNNAKRTFRNMGFSAKTTGKTMDALTKSILGLPTSLDQAVSGVELLAGATNNLKKSQKIYTALNDAILGFGGSADMVQGAIIQVSQAFANGKVDAQTWNSLIQQGLGPALNALARSMGLTVGKLKEQLSDGTISVGEFQDALIKMDKKGGGGMKSFQKIAQDATSGIGTGIDNAKTAVVRGIAKIIQAVGSKNISNAISGIGTGFENILGSIGKGLGSVKGFFKYLDDKKKSIKSGDFSSLGTSIGAGIASGLNAAIKGITITENAVSKWFSSIDWGKLGLQIGKQAVAFALGFAIGLANFDWDSAWMVLKNNWFEALLAVLTIVFLPSKLLGPLAKIFGRIPLVGPIARWFVTGIRGAFPFAREAIGSLFEGASGAIAGALGRIGLVFRTLGQVMVAPFKLLDQAAGLAIRLLPTTVVDALTGILNAFRSFGSGLWSVASSVFNGVVTIIRVVFAPITAFFRSLFSAAGASIRAVFTPVGDFFRTIYLRITGVIARFPTFVLNTFVKARNFITSTFSNIAGWFGARFNAAWAAVKRPFAGASSYFKGVWDRITKVFSNAGTRVGNAVGSSFKAVINKVLRGAISAVNGFIGSIDSIIGVINKLPGPNIGKISKLSVPQLASGGIVSSATLALIGEGKEPEAVVPLSKLDQMMSRAAPQQRVGDTYHIEINVHGTFATSKQEQRKVANVIAQRLQEIKNSKAVGVSTA